jgi:hypothetical protein
MMERTSGWFHLIPQRRYNCFMGNLKKKIITEICISLSNLQEVGVLRKLEKKKKKIDGEKKIEIKSDEAEMGAAHVS